jgi:3-isopropylmalate/(R)-2-methylmalate dehydratase small subunit
MAHELQGRVWLLPDDIQAAQIAPVNRVIDVEDIDPARALLADVVPGLAAKIQPGDFLWAGEGFGHGTSREDAPLLIKRAGIRLVLAASFAHTFYRNAINVGLPVAVGHPGETHDEDEIQVNLVTGEVCNVTQDFKQKVEPVPKVVRPILTEGGLIAYVKAHGGLPHDNDVT